MTQGALLTEAQPQETALLLHQHLFIVDNYLLLKSLEAASIDLICTDPPFAKNKTFQGTLDPPLRADEMDEEHTTLQRWGIHNAADAEQHGVVWPTQEDAAHCTNEIWSSDDGAVEQWLHASDLEGTLGARSAAEQYVTPSLFAANGSEPSLAAPPVAAASDVGATQVHPALDLVVGGPISDGGSDRASYDDSWSWGTDVEAAWMDEITDRRPGVLTVIEAARCNHSEGTAAYLAYMAVRLIECHRVLKPTGAIYLHCDHTVNSYLRLLLDAIFGRENFRNEIIWPYRTGGVSKKHWPRKHDTLLFYVKSALYSHTPIQERIYYDKPFFTTKTDEQGRHYADVYVRDVWDDLKPLVNTSNERTGYPTQKSVEMAERMLLASSKPGDVVLDVFAGCGYVPIAAAKLDRRWIACDISPRAMTVLRRQFKKFGYAVDGVAPEGVLAVDGTSLARGNIIVCGPADLPERTTDGDEHPMIAPLPERQYKTKRSIFTREEMLSFLLELSGWRAWCCGYANILTLADGTSEVVRTIRNFELDHIDPKSKAGRHEIDNRAPLCPAHNSLKSNRRIHLEELRAEVIRRGDLLVASPEDLVKLPWARDAAIDYLTSEKARRIGTPFPSMH